MESSTLPGSDRTFYVFNALLSTVAIAFLGWLLLLRGEAGSAGVSVLPAVNASLNGLAAALLVAGWVAIRTRRRRLHQGLMTGAFVASSAFLISYVYYHYAAGHTPYGGTGWMRGLYFSVLISHVLLSVAIVPMALSAFYFAFQKRFGAHRRVTRVLLPIWLYVSVTGVLIFFMLRGV